MNMKGNALAFILLLMMVASAYAQLPSDTIVVMGKKDNVYKYQGKILTVNKLKKIAMNVPETQGELRMTMTNYNAAAALGGIGGMVLGGTLGFALAGEKVIWPALGIGAGLIVASIPFSKAYSLHLRETVRIYNDAVVSRYDGPQLGLGLTSSGGLGLVVRLR